MLLRSLLGNYARQAVTTQLRDVMQNKIQADRDQILARADEPIAAAVVFAVNSESGGLLDLCTDLLTTQIQDHVVRSGRLKKRTILILETGIGIQNSQSATAAMLAAFDIPLVFSAGFAASLTDKHRKGDILLIEKAMNAKEEELNFEFNIDRSAVDENPCWHFAKLVSADEEVRTREARHDLATKYQVEAVDMETHGIAAACRDANVLCLPVRVVTDAFNDDDRQMIDSISNQQTLAGKLGAAAGAIWKKPKIATEMIGLKQAAIERSDQLAKFLAGMIGQLPPNR